MRRRRERRRRDEEEGRRGGGGGEEEEGRRGGGGGWRCRNMKVEEESTEMMCRATRQREHYRMVHIGLAGIAPDRHVCQRQDNIVTCTLMVLGHVLVDMTTTAILIKRRENFKQLKYQNSFQLFSFDQSNHQ